MDPITNPRSRRSRRASSDRERTGRLLLDDGLVSGRVDAAQRLSGGLDLVPLRPVPASPIRLLHAAGKDHVGAALLRRDAARSSQLRRRVLGASAAGPPRFLVRVDEFPHYLAWDEPDRYGTEAFRRFHEIMHAAEVGYLIAALPRVSRRPLDPTAGESRPLTDEERVQFAQLAREGVEFGLHGRDHRTRSSDPRRRSELTGLDRAATEQLLDTALAELEEQIGERPRVFIAPYNRYEIGQWPALAARFAVIGGGPESVRSFGIQSTPQWYQDAVYLPAYSPLYGRAQTVLPAVLEAIEQRSGLWTPVVLHWGWEADAGWGDLERLAQALAPHTVTWSEFLAAVERSR